MRRSPRWIALGVVALCLGALGAFFLYNQASEAREVVAVRSTVYRGTTLTADDLTVVRVGNTAGIRTVPATELAGLVGQQATVDLMQGTLLAPGAVARTVLPETGHSVVGVKLAAGRAPTGFLQPSSPVRLIALPPSGAQPDYRDDYSGLSIDATVLSLTPTADRQSVVVDLDVASAQAGAAAALAATDRLVLVRDPER
ncbi:hypothetical protein FHX74_001206 [Friedmanniella endophytica]|uniref:AFP-like domain-containing protein n=1 Tax=Microlunatus kandeliicorticis TaxID=1759536 RepID=A0A7W3IQX1_9ACTN|nr:hypothetical protein [Microlunatus kandeliicorticis]